MKKKMKPMEDNCVVLMFNSSDSMGLTKRERPVITEIWRGFLPHAPCIFTCISVTTVRRDWYH